MPKIFMEKPLGNPAHRIGVTNLSYSKSEKLSVSQNQLKFSEKCCIFELNFCFALADGVDEHQPYIHIYVFE